MSDSSNDRIKAENQLIFLLLRHKSALTDFAEKGFSPDFFTQENKDLVNLILQTYHEYGVSLTPDSFREHLKKISFAPKRISLDASFIKCYSAETRKDNLPILMRKVLDNAMHDSLNKALLDVQKDIKDSSIPIVDVLRKLSDSCESILVKVNFTDEKTFYNDSKLLIDSVLENVDGVRTGKITEDPIILSGIPEVDDTMGTGFEKGTLTLYCADVGGFKSAMLLNNGINIADAGYNVLYIPLEMDKEQMIKRLLSRYAKVDSRKLFKDKKLLSDEEFERLKEAREKIYKREKGNLYIMQRPGVTTVLDIEKEIRRHAEIFKPHVVIIDYVANLEAHKERYGRNDLEIGDQLKRMRQMGKELGFAVISAAQLGRDALKRLRKTASSKDKPQVHSEDIRGSHEYAADADNIFAMMKDSQQPGSRLHLFCVKARNGKTYFGEDPQKVRATLNVVPKYGFIYSPSEEKSDIDEEQLDKMIADTEAYKMEIVKKKDEETFFDEDKEWNDWMGSSDKMSQNSVQIEETEHIKEEDNMDFSFGDKIHVEASDDEINSILDEASKEN